MRYLAAIVLLSAGVQAHAATFHQGPKLLGTGAGAVARQGFSVALSADGNTAIVGGRGDVGAAWVFTRSAGVWRQQGSKLVGTLGAAATQGWAVDLSADGNTAIVGGPTDGGATGAAWVFLRSAGTWIQQYKLVGTGGSGAELGWSVALSADGNTALAGGPYDNGLVGAAWVFTRSGGVWTQQGGKLLGTGGVGLAEFGYSVALSSDGNTALVGGPTDDSSAGAVWVFTRSGGVWTQQGQRLVGSGASGAANQGMSAALSADGNTALVGGMFDSGEAGAVWVFTRSGGVWTQQGDKLVGAGGIGTGRQGRAVDLSGDGNTALVGGYYDAGLDGGAWVFKRSGAVWTQQGEKVMGSAAVGHALQGTSVALSSDGETAILGGEGDDAFSGAAWVFMRLCSMGGDANADDTLDVADVFYLINYLFAGGAPPGCR